MPSFSKNYSSNYDIGGVVTGSGQADNLFKIYVRNLIIAQADALFKIYVKGLVITWADALFNVNVNWNPVHAFTHHDFNEDFDIDEETFNVQKDTFFKVLPKFLASNDNLFTVYAHWRIPSDQLISVTIPMPPEIRGIVMDPVLNIMLLLKNSWSLTEASLTASDINFTTGWYDNNLQMPQITVTPAYNRKQVLETGETPLYKFEDTIYVNVWVRPLQDSGKSLGWAKQSEFKIRKEVERILRSGSHLGTNYNNEEFFYIGKWRRMDDLRLRPAVLRSMYEIKDYFFRQNYEEG